MTVYKCMYFFLFFFHSSSPISVFLFFFFVLFFLLLLSLFLVFPPSKQLFFEEVNGSIEYNGAKNKTETICTIGVQRNPPGELCYLRNTYA